MGGETSEKITGLRAILASIAKPSVEAARLANQLGLEFNASALQAKGLAGFLEEVAQKTGGNVDTLAKLFGGVEALVPMIALAGQAGKDFAQILQDMANKAGATEIALEKISVPGDKFKNLMSSLEVVALSAGDALANVLAPAAGAAADAINNLFGIKQLSAIDQQKQKIAELQEQLASMNDRKNIPVIGDLIFDKRQADLLSQQIEDYQSDLVKMEQAAKDSSAAINKESDALNALDLALKPVTESRNKNTSATNAQISEGERFLQSLTREAEQLGKTSAEIKRMEAAKLGVLDVAAPLIDKIEQENKALKAQQIQVDSITKNLQRYQEITESVLTDREKYNRQVQILNEARNATDGTAISQETYNRALKQAEEQFLKTGKAGRDALDEISQFSIQAQRNLQNALGDALFDGINSRFGDMVDGFARAIQQMLAQALAADIWGALFNKPTGNLAALSNMFGFSGNASAGSSGSGILDIASMGSNAASFIRTGFGFTKLAGNGLSAIGGSSSLGSFGAGMAGGSEGAAFIAAESAASGAGSAAGMGATFASYAGPLAAAGAGIFGGSLIAGNKKIGPMTGTMSSASGAALGAAIGSVVPGIGTAIGAFVGGILGGAVNALFGRGPLKQKETILDATVDTDGIESGALRTNFKAKGGVFRSDKHDFISSDLITNEFSTDNKKLTDYEESLSQVSKAIVKQINETVSGVSKSVYSMADSLELSKQPLDDFSTQIQIASKSGESLTQEQIGQELNRITDEMVTALVPGIAELGRTGETTLQALTRLGAEFESLENATAVLTGSAKEANEAVKGLTFEQRTDLVNRAGGTDALNSQIGFFASNFLAPDEQYKVSFDLLNDELGKLGLSADMTKEQYAELIRSVTEVGGVSVETASKLLELAPAFLNVKNAADQLKASVNQNLLSLAGNLAPDEVLGIKYSMMSDTLSQFGISADISREQLIEYVREFVNSGGLLTAAAQSVMNTVGITLDYLNTVDQQKANAAQNTLSLAETFAPEEVVNIKFGMLNGVLSELGIAADTSKEELIKLLKEFVASGGLYGPLAEKVIRVAGLLADANNTLDQINMKGVNDAYAALQRSIDSERTQLTNEYNTALEGINTQIESVTDSISKLKSLSDALKSTVNAIRPMERSEAKAQIEAALNTAKQGGGLPDVENIREALDTLRQQSTSGFTSSFDFAFEQAKTASMLGELGALTDDQLSTEERSLNALKDSKKSLEDGFRSEMTRLDKILEDAQTQIGLLTGIEENTKSIADALRSFQIAVSNAGMGGNVGGFSGVSNADIRAYVAAHPDPMDQYNAAIANDVTALQYSQATGTPVSAINKFTSDNGLAPLARGFDQRDVNTYFQNYGGDNVRAAKDAFQFGASASEISKATGFSIDEINAYTESLGLGKLSKYSDGGFTGSGGKFQPAGIVHAGEYVFSQEAVNNLGLHTLDQLHETAKHGRQEGYANGGLVGAQNIINRTDVNRINSITDKNIIDARSLFEERIAANDIVRELTKQHESIKDITSTAYVLSALNDTRGISDINNVLDAKHIFENRAASREVNRIAFADDGFIGGDIDPAPIVENTRPTIATSNNNQSIQLNQDDVIAELRLLREEIKQVREYNRRMSNKFDAVTQGGTAFRTKTA